MAASAWRWRLGPAPVAREKRDSSSAHPLRPPRGAVRAAAWFALGEAREKLGDAEGAADAIPLAADPSEAQGAAARLALIGRGEAPRALPEAYVARLFDDYPPRFDAHFTGSLSYRARPHRRRAGGGRPRPPVRARPRFRLRDGPHGASGARPRRSPDRRRLCRANGRRSRIAPDSHLGSVNPSRGPTRGARIGLHIRAVVTLGSSGSPGQKAPPDLRDPRAEV
jgi:hypothetical protein